MKCKHRSATWSRWEDGAWVLVGHLVGPPLAEHGRFFKDRLVCDCGEWLPMGEANDGGEFAEQVAVEKLAAKWAETRGNVYCSNDMWSGFEAHKRGWDPDPPRECQAGWLAREIVMHERTAEAAERRIAEYAKENA